MKSGDFIKAFFILFLLSLCLVAEAAEFKLTSRVVVLGAPRLNLILNEEYLITHTLVKARSKGKYSEDVVAFQNLAWNMNEAAYRQLRQEGFSSELNAMSSNADFLKTYSQFFNLLKNTPEYKLILKEVQDYMSESLYEWDTNLEKSVPFMLKYSGFTFNYDVYTYITHPAVGNGRNWGSLMGNKTITFGAWPTFANYFTVYIWHEIIHFYMESDEISHAVNQLLTDNQLRIFFNGGTLTPLEGHKDLMNIMEKNLDRWQEYKKSPTDLNLFVKQIIKLKK
ncbi:MAG: hypothetical protein AABY53_08265 [Bdellovibrionota bacterium]